MSNIRKIIVHYTTRLAVVANLVLRESGLDGRVHFHLDLSSGLLLRRATAARNALRLSETLLHSLRREGVKVVSLDGIHSKLVVGVDRREAARHCINKETRTEKALSGAARLDDLQETGPKRLDAGDVRSKNTKVTVCRRDVDLGDFLVVVQSL